MTTDTLDKARLVARAIDAKQGRDVVVVDVGDIISITDVFVFAHGLNTRQVRTIVEEVERQVREESGEKPRSREGVDDGSWVLLDYGDVVVHVFLEESRDHYSLDRLWADAPRIETGLETGREPGVEDSAASA